MLNGTSKKIYLAIFYILCLVAAVAFVSYHLLNLLTSDIVTVRAEEKHAKESLSCIGYLARDEKTLDFPGGTVRFMGNNGSKFIKGEACAELYSDSAKEILGEIDALSKEYDILSKALYYSTLAQSSSDSDLYYKRLMDSLSKNNAATENDSNSLYGAQLSIDYVFDRESIREALKKTEEKRDALLNKLGTPYAKISMPETGYFFKTGDSLGDVFNSNLAENATADELMRALSEYENGEYEEKETLTYTLSPKWYIIAKITVEESKKYDKNNYYTILLGEKKTEMKAFLGDVRNTSDGKNTFLVFSLTELTHELDYERSFELEIISDEFDCYRIPFSALRNDKNGGSGVYVMSGGVVVFRRVEIISTHDTYVLVRSYSDYMEKLENGKEASGIYNSKEQDSLYIGIYPGGPYSYFDGSETMPPSKLNISDYGGGGEIDLLSDSEAFEFSYLEENEAVIIKGNNLYHGKIPG